jgi:perosamine synthetase
MMHLARPSMGSAELTALSEVFASGVLTNGPVTQRFERAVADVQQARFGVALSSGTVALSAMLLAHGITAGDEVIVPSLTFVGTATAVRHVGAVPVFADVLPDTFDLDPDDVGARVTPRTRAVMPVHYAGQIAGMTGLASVAEEHGLLLLEDAAQALGSRSGGRPAGSWSTMAMFSFTPTKIVTTGEAGVVVTDDGDLAERLRRLRNHGLDRDTFVTVGYNWRITEMQAAIGVVQLGRLADLTRDRRRNAAHLTHLLHAVPGVTPPRCRDGAAHNYTLYTVLLDAALDRAGIIRALARDGVQSKVYYPPVHTSGLFPPVDKPLPVTDDVGRRMVSLPVHAQLTVPDMDHIAAALTRAVAQQKGSVHGG